LPRARKKVVRCAWSCCPGSIGRGVADSLAFSARNRREERHGYRASRAGPGAVVYFLSAHRLRAPACPGAGRPGIGRCRPCSGTGDRPGGPAHLGRAYLAGAHVVRPGGDVGHHHAISSLLRPTRCAGEDHSGPAVRAEPCQVLVGVRRRPDLRVRAARGREVPQRRDGDLRGREVLLREVSRRRQQGPEGPRRVGRDPGSAARPLQAQAALAGLHDLLYERHGGSLGGAEEVRRERRR
jgi:hypothetical protein